MSHDLNHNLLGLKQKLAGRLAAMAAILALVALITPGVVAAAISQGYKTDSALAAGTLVSGVDTGSDTNKAVPASLNNADTLLGAVVGAKDATLSVTAPEDRVQVATTGIAKVFISDINGEVKAGDQVGTSALEGVGAKALTSGKVVGVAQTDATYSGATATVKSSDGQNKTVRLGSVPVTVQVAYYNPPVQKSPVPAFLQVFANSIAGKQVSIARILISSLILVGSLVGVSVLLYSAVRNTMVSIGRNPLAHSSIYRGLWQVIVTCVIVLIIALGSSYVVLTR